MRLSEKYVKLIGKQTSEKWFEADLVKRVKAAGGECWKMVVVNKAGIPDRLVLLPGGEAMFVELKSRGEEPKPRQQMWIKKLRKLGFDVRVAGDTPDSYIELLNDYELYTK